MDTFGTSPPNGSTFLLCFAWAFIAGSTLPLATVNNAMINSRSSHSDYHAFYTTMLGIILGGVSVLPLALRPPFKWSEMQSVWPWLGGLCTLPAFGMLVAVPALGVQ